MTQNITDINIKDGAGAVQGEVEKVSFDDNDIPIIVNSSASFEERVLEASPDATATLRLVPCDNCGRKFNKESSERHMKVNLCKTIIGLDWSVTKIISLLRYVPN